MDLGEECGTSAPTGQPEARGSATHSVLHSAANQGLGELRQLIACVKQMFSLLGYGGAAAAGAGGGDVVEQMAAAQEVYLAMSAALRQTLKACASASSPAACGASGVEAIAGAGKSHAGSSNCMQRAAFAGRHHPRTCLTPCTLCGSRHGRTCMRTRRRLHAVAASMHSGLCSARGGL